MAFQSKRRDSEEEEIQYSDNIIQWQDAIGEKLDKMRSAEHVFSISQKGDFLLGVKAISETSEKLFSQLEKKELYLPYLEKMSEGRKQEWLTVRLLLKELLSGEEKEIHYHPSGQPYFADNSYFLSISHTKGYVAVILNKHHPVAIDIENISPRIEKIQERFLSEREKENLSKENRLNHLLLHWAAKECLFKILGEEGVEYKSHLHIQKFQPLSKQWDSFSAKETRTDKRESYTIDYYISDDFVLSLINGSQKKGLPLQNDYD
ncbi:4'-phosphopantetheinyl transferase superfamily protein [Bacteroidales bacterium OttesenSCG-928-M11]|nr:4'-phosphopantetheinyl transferase superfamily protein [Bacteroidales bacterium OttesenSCG-928-M11]